MFRGETQGVTPCWTLWRWGESGVWGDRRGGSFACFVDPFWNISVDTIREGQAWESASICTATASSILVFVCVSRWHWLTPLTTSLERGAH